MGWGAVPTSAALRCDSPPERLLCHMTCELLLKGPLSRVPDYSDITWSLHHTTVFRGFAVHMISGVSHLCVWVCAVVSGRKKRGDIPNLDAAVLSRKREGLMGILMELPLPLCTNLENAPVQVCLIQSEHAHGPPQQSPPPNPRPLPPPASPMILQSGIPYPLT